MRRHVGLGQVCGATISRVSRMISLTRHRAARTRRGRGGSKTVCIAPIVVSRFSSPAPFCSYRRLASLDSTALTLRHIRLATSSLHNHHRPTTTTTSSSSSSSLPAHRRRVIRGAASYRALLDDPRSIRAEFLRPHPLCARTLCRAWPTTHDPRVYSSNDLLPVVHAPIPTLALSREHGKCNVRRLEGEEAAVGEHGGVWRSLRIVCVSALPRSGLRLTGAVDPVDHHHHPAYHFTPLTPPHPGLPIHTAAMATLRLGRNSPRSAIWPPIPRRSSRRSKMIWPASVEGWNSRQREAAVLGHPSSLLPYAHHAQSTKRRSTAPPRGVTQPRGPRPEESRLSAIPARSASDSRPWRGGRLGRNRRWIQVCPWRDGEAMQHKQRLVAYILIPGTRTTMPWRRNDVGKRRAKTSPMARPRVLLRTR